jgi:murein L,D-transpeptidase YafK
MKTAIFLSCVLVGGSLLYTNSTTETSKTFISYKVTKAKKTSAKPVGPVRIVVDKSDYELTVYDEQGWYATYPVVFGNNPLLDKKMEGDRCTPEGSFKIVAKKPHEKWSRFMLLDYPNQESLQKFNQRKQRGEIPKNATPGGGVGIHGTWAHEDFIIDRYKNWTLGCISLKNADVLELYSYIPSGTPVTIKK